MEILFSDPNIDPEKIIYLEGDSYLVPSESQEGVSYLVDMVTRCCTCPQGQLCGPCKHKVAVSRVKNIPCFDVLPTHSPEMRQTYMFIGTGRMLPLDWFLPVQAEIVPHNDEDLSQQVQGHAQCNIEPVAEMNRITTEEPVLAEDISEAVKSDFQKVWEKLGSKILTRIQHDPAGYAKAVERLDKTVERLPARGDAVLQKSLCEFGKSATQVLHNQSTKIIINFNVNLGMFCTEKKKDWSHPSSSYSTVS